MREGEVLELRELDAEGVSAMGIDPADALTRAALASLEHFVITIDGLPVAAWGYAAHGMGGVSAYGWLLTSPAVELYPMRFLRESKRAVEYILRRNLRLEVSVLKAHDISAKWLKWLGFTPCGETSTYLLLERFR